MPNPRGVRHSYRPWSPAEAAELARLLGEGALYPEVGRRLGRAADAVRAKATALGLNPKARGAAAPLAAPPVEPPALAPDTTADAATVESPPSPSIRTLDDLLAAARVDLAVWEVERFVVNKWEVGAKLPDGGGIAVAPLFQVKAWLTRRVSEAQAAFRAALLADIAADTRARALTAPPRPARAPRPEERAMLEVCLMDLHVGKYAWGEETGTDYDTEIAAQLAEDALGDLLAQASRYAIDRVTLPLGNDFFHYDTVGGATTAGTPQDRDTRWQRMYRRGRAIASAMIARCAAVAPTLVVVVPGNHAEVLEWTLGEVLAAEFRHDPRVTIENTARPRKYVRYGRNLLMYAHGHQEPHAELPLIMATEEPALWAETRYREVHLGHLHHSRARDKHAVGSQNGVRTRVLPSLSGTDSWHARKGYVGEPRAAEAFVWRFTGGLRANLFAYPAWDADDAALRQAGAA